MSDSAILQIERAITEAKQREASSHVLQHFLQDKIGELHRSIKLPKEHGDEALVLFVTRYIEHVPEFLNALTELAKSAGIYKFVKRFVDIATAYFEQPPELVKLNHEGLHALIDEAYLAHRLVEEVNDRIMLNCGIPLAPMDMTLSNIIVHDILGDEFANELDLAVHYSVEVIFNGVDLKSCKDFSRYVETHLENGWQKELEKWPCLVGDSAIQLELDHRPLGAALH